jgi:enoyl-CoA hydratase
MMGTYETVRVEREDAVGVITLNRPKALNALSGQLLRELAAAVDELEKDDAIGCILVTGSEKAFAAGADIKEMQPRGYIDVFISDLFTVDAERLASCRKPTLAAVAGYALGGGCELAMMCDTIIAADNAKFGQPEITVGTIAGIGGTQRLTRAVGKAVAMDVCLTGRMIDAAEAKTLGLVSRVVAPDRLMEEARKMAKAIASMSRPAAMLTKEAVNRAFETMLSEGIRFERRVFHSTFAFEDQKEGMSAFIAKRPPKFKNR